MSDISPGVMFAGASRLRALEYAAARAKEDAGRVRMQAQAADRQEQPGACETLVLEAMHKSHIAGRFDAMAEAEREQ